MAATDLRCMLARCLDEARRLHACRRFYGLGKFRVSGCYLFKVQGSGCEVWKDGTSQAHPSSNRCREKKYLAQEQWQKH